MMVLACLVIVASFVLRVQEDGVHVAVGGAPSLELPPTCLSNTLFGVRCPGCGLTRSFVYLAHGDFLSSFRVHHLGWLLFALTLCQIPYRLYQIFHTDKSKALLTFASWVGRVLLVLLLANWLGVLLFGG